MKKYLIALFIASFIAVPALSFAEVTDIDPISSSSECVNIVNSLRYRDRDINKNGEVSTLQDFLQVQGYLNSEPTGYLGILTVKAVKEFQKNNNINPTGYVGSVTRLKIKDVSCGGGYESNIRLIYPASASTIKAGSSINVRWESSNISPNDSIKIIIRKNNSIAPFSNEVITLNDGQETVNIPLNTPTGRYEVEYGVFSEQLGGPMYKKFGSAYFIVIPADITNESSVRLIYPNSASTIKAGSSINVRWESFNISGRESIKIIIRKNDSIIPFHKEVTTLNDGQEIVTIPLLTPQGKYEVEYGTYSQSSGGGEYYTKYGTAYFIVTSLTSTPSITNIIGSQLVYGPNSPIKLDIKTNNGNNMPASLVDGYYIHAYVFPASDPNFLGNYLPPNPPGSYNGTYYADSGLWKLNLLTPGAGSYLLRVVLYCSNSTLCGGTPESVKVLPFTVSELTTPTLSMTVLSPNGGETFRKGSPTYAGDFLPYKTEFYSKKIGETKNYITQSNNIKDWQNQRYYWISGADGWNPGNNVSSGSSQLDASIISGSYYWLTTWKSKDGLDSMYDFSDSYFKIVDSTTPSTTVLSPNGGETFTAGQQMTVRWNSSNSNTNAVATLILLDENKNLTQNLIELPRVTIPDNGAWTSVLNSSLLNGRYYVKICQMEGACDISNDAFLINSPLSPTPSITVLSPNGNDVYTAGQQITASWTSTNLLPSDNLQIGLVKDVSGMYYPLTSSTLNDGTQALTIPFNVQVGQYKLHITKGGTTVEDYSNSTFTINAAPVIVPSVSMIYPNGGETFTTGQPITLRWQTENVPSSSTVNLYLVTRLADPQSSIPSYPRQAVIAENIPNSGSYTWTVNSTVLTANNYLVLIDGRTTGENAGYFVDLSDNLLTVNATPSSTVDTTPRIMYFSGKINQHTDASGTWQTDPDGASGTNIDKLIYCKKWFPSTTSVANYKLETINTWRDGGNTGAYTSEKLSFKCVGGTISSKSTLSSLMQANALGAFNNTKTIVEQKPQVNTNTNVSSCGEFTNTLKRGMEDPQVKCLQKMLNQKGFKIQGIAEGNETNFFGSRTLEALKAFQAQNGLDADGVFGSASRRALAN